MSALLLIASAVAALLVLTFLSITGYLHYVHWKYSHLPQPKRSSFFFGHASDMVTPKEISIARVIQRWSDEVQSPTYVVFMLNQPIVITTDPDNVRTIMMKPTINKEQIIMKPLIEIMGERFMGKGILTIPDYETWKPRRQLYEPSFRKSYLNTLLASFNEIIGKFLNQLDDGTSKQPMKLRFGELTLDMISKVAFGLDDDDKLMNASKREKGMLRTAVSTSSKGIDVSIRNPMFQYLHPFEAAKYRQAAKDVRAIGRDCIKRRIKMIESGEQVPNDILTHILQIPFKTVAPIVNY